MQHTIVAVEGQYYILCVILSSVACLPPQYFLMNITEYKKRIFIFLQLLSETFFILMILCDVINNIYFSLCEVPIIFVKC